MLTIILQKSLAEIDIIPVFWAIICLLFTGLLGLLIYFWSDYRTRDTEHKRKIEELLGDHGDRLTKLEHFKVAVETLAATKHPNFPAATPGAPIITPAMAAYVLPLITSANEIASLFPQVQ